MDARKLLLVVAVRSSSFFVSASINDGDILYIETKKDRWYFVKKRKKKEKKQENIR